MSSIEKALNKEDLKAYKQLDDRHYSLVPGLQHNRFFSPVPSPVVNSDATRV